MSPALAPDEHVTSFLTFHHYVGALAQDLHSRAVRARSPWHWAFEESYQLSRGTVRARPVARDTLDLRLARGWSNLLGLLRDVESTDFYEEVNAWSPVKAWYSVHHSFSGLLLFVAPSASRPTHELTCREAAKLAAARRLLPYPWSLHVSGTQDAGIQYRGFLTRVPKDIEELSPPRPETFEDRIGKALRTTADWRAQPSMDGWRRKNPPRRGRSRRNVPRLEKARIATSLGSTTLFDLLYRLRIRANYGDADTFVLGARSLDEAHDFARNLAIVADMTMGVIEGIVSAYVGRDRFTDGLQTYATKRRCQPSDAVGARLRLLTL